MAKCSWALASVIEEQYHDEEWGVPVHDDRLLFEFLILEGAQAGLSWRTILNKRNAYRLAFANFEVEIVAGYDEAMLQKLLLNPDLVRNKLKLQSAITNARAFIEVKQQFGSFDRYIWQFVEGRTVQNQWRKAEDLPTYSHQSEQMSKSLKQKGFSFVGPSICYAYMQAIGMVNDHIIDCFRHQQLTLFE